MIGILKGDDANSQPTIDKLYPRGTRKRRRTRKFDFAWGPVLMVERSGSVHGVLVANKINLGDPSEMTKGSFPRGRQQKFSRRPRVPVRRNYDVETTVVFQWVG